MTTFTRRQVLRSAGVAAVAGTMATSTPVGAFSATATGRFGHGIASGDPLPDSVLLWTRVTPTTEPVPAPARPGVTVGWQVAATRVREGRRAGQGRHRRRPRPHGQGGRRRARPGTTYFYRFTHGGVSSRAGRTRTAPAAERRRERPAVRRRVLRQLQAGWFSAYRHLAARDDLDAVLHLGDYLYEYGPGEYGYGFDEVDIRPHEPPHEMVALADYRQPARAVQDATPTCRTCTRSTRSSSPGTTTRSANDAVDRRRGEPHRRSEGDYRARQAPRAPGVRRVDARPDERHRRARRRHPALPPAAVRHLAEISMLDLRTYRDEQVGRRPRSPTRPAISDPDRTITGARRWTGSRTR